MTTGKGEKKREPKNRWAEYLGRTQESPIAIPEDRMRGLAALLDYPEPPWPDGEVPPTGHWCHLFPYTLQSELGKDGHEKPGSFLPPVSQPLRMWAGGYIELLQPMYIGESYTFRSTIRAIEEKEGRSGPMTFVTVCHEYLDNGALKRRDVQHIVYREAAAAPLPAPANRTIQSSKSADAYDWSAQIFPDTTLLFRYSAVSFNAHRIHYDRDYVLGEGYPGLLVHAPLTATLLIDLFQRSCPGTGIRYFEYAARSPMYDGYPFTVMGRRTDNGKVSLRAEDCDGKESMIAELETDRDGLP